MITSEHRNKDDLIHREDGPAITYHDGSKCWVINGEYHRDDGPAIEWANGDKWWYFHGKYINVKSQKEFEQYVKLLAFI
jgi:hypothetical protein